MHLKKLEVVGFKSFAEPIQMEFSPGVAGVVGPNGSGKSNVIDCVRWVLGEQSIKSLRGSKLEDVIFAGSDTRKKLNMAEVTLTLDNTDGYLPVEYQEISITRRVYRSGESDFYLNKKKCRLKDIVELFLDTGLSREAFSIIGQGKVEEILSSKPEERRVIFEEAAGVLKYKTRKKKTLVKLEEANDNLIRVEDILHELEQQLTPVRAQAETAKDYLEKKEQLKNHEVALIVREVEDLHGKWNEKKESCSTLKGKVADVGHFLSIEEAKEEKWKLEAIQLDEEIEKAQQSLLQKTEEVQVSIGKREVFEERLLHGDKNIAEKADSQVVLEQQIAEIKQNIEQTVNEEKNVRGAIKELNQRIGAIQDKMLDAPKSLEAQAESLKSNYIEKRNEEATSKNELQNVEENKRRISYQLEKYNRRYTELLAERDGIAKDKRELLVAREGLQKRLDAKKVKMNDWLDEIESLSRQENELKTAQNQMLRDLQHTKSRRDALAEMKEDYTGYQFGTREVLKAAKSGQLKGIEGAVAECMQVPAGLEIAMELTLGGSMQNIIAENEACAQEAIGYLKQTKKGRATFLPMTVIQPRIFPNAMKTQLQSNPDFVGVASELIQFDLKYQGIFGNLLGNVLVAKNLKSANDMAKFLSYRYRIVTLEGDVLNPGGSMSGGSMKQTNTPLFTRTRELEQLQRKYEELSHAIEASRRELEQVTAKEQAIREQMVVIEKETQADVADKIEQDAKIRELEISSRSIEEKIALIDLEKSQIEIQSKDFDVKKQHNEKKLHQIEMELIQLQDAMKKNEQAQKMQTETAALLLEEVTQARVAFAQKNEQLEHLLESKNREREQQRRLEEQLTEIEQYLSTQTNQLMHAKEELAMLLTEIDAGEVEKETLKTQLVQLRKSRFEMHEQLETLEKVLKQYKSELRDAESRLKQDELQLNRLDYELETHLNFLREEYTLTFEAAKEKYVLEGTEDTVRRTVKKLHQSIESLGMVNLGAIEEFKRLDERNTFLNTQKADMLQARDNLYEIIQEMDEEMDRRFGQTFFAIQEQFQNVFRKLFGGGHAKLVLTTPSDLLTSGIEIIAQPPGKKLTNLSLLSGGERAFTAIALLFSILKVRPVPFCILDEVEAALDEANVLKFAQYVKQFSQDTQFIVITHRKGTMENCDVLYGVTMQESGVSKIVSVRMVEEAERIVQEKVGQKK